MFVGEIQCRLFPPLAAQPESLKLVMTSFLERSDASLHLIPPKLTRERGGTTFGWEGNSEVSRKQNGGPATHHT